jgi:hypothetical protein
MKETKEPVWKPIYTVVLIANIIYFIFFWIITNTFTY